MIKFQGNNDDYIKHIAKKLVSHTCGQTLEGNLFIPIKTVYKLYFDLLPWDIYIDVVVPDIESYIWQDERVLDVIVDANDFDINVGTAYITENFEWYL